MSEQMELTDKNLEAIGSYVKGNLPDWLREVEMQERAPAEAVRTDPQLLERMVRVEEELKHQRELMRERFDAIDQRFAEQREDFIARFEQVDKRFEQVDKRFEQVDKRFEQVDQRFAEQRKDFAARFEQADKRLEELRTDMNQRFSMMFRFMSIGFVALAVLMTVYELIS